ncbi:MAG: ComEC/Rec2 family competence protein [Holosporales bacterium]|nr:ComEC/Rec2 family competence protein [Holosporales bacterium]
MTKFKEFLLLERERIPLFASVILGIGIICGVFFPFLSWRSLVAFLGLSATSCRLIFKRSKLLATAILVFTLGVYVSQTGGIFETTLLTNKKFIDREYDKVTFFADVGFIDATHPIMKNMQRIVFRNIQFPDEDLGYIKTAKMTCPSRAIADLVPNDRCKVVGNLMPYKMAAIPSSFDQAQFNALNKMDATGVVLFTKKMNQDQGGGAKTDVFAYLRRTLTQTIMEKMVSPAGGVACSLITGDKSPITQDIRDNFINTGTAHILAISGLHMSLIASILFFIFFRINLYLSCIFKGIRARKISAILTILFTYLYLAISGFSPSAVRAFIMTTICLLGVIFGRGALSMRSVSTAAFLILLFDSGALFLVSFQLSFSAVVALIAFYEKYSSTLSEWRFKNNSFWKTIYSYIALSAVTTFIASVATFPISVATFNRLSLAGIFGNLFAIPMVSLIIMPLGIIAMSFGYFTDVITNFLEGVINFLIYFLGIIAEMPGSNITLKSPEIMTLYILMMGGIILCLLKTKFKHIGSVLIVMASIMWIIQEGPDIIMPPNLEVICHIDQDGNFYTTSVRKGRNQIISIQRNLGFSGKLKKKEFTSIEVKSHPQGLYIWTGDNGVTKRKQMARRLHPYCPAYLEDVE